MGVCHSQSTFAGIRTMSNIIGFRKAAFEKEKYPFQTRGQTVFE